MARHSTQILESSHTNLVWPPPPDAPSKIQVALFGANGATARPGASDADGSSASVASGSSWTTPAGQGHSSPAESAWQSQIAGRAAGVPQSLALDLPLHAAAPDTRGAALLGDASPAIHGSEMRLAPRSTSFASRHDTTTRLAAAVVTGFLLVVSSWVGYRSTRSRQLDHVPPQVARVDVTSQNIEPSTSATAVTPGAVSAVSGLDIPPLDTSAQVTDPTRLQKLDSDLALPGANVVTAAQDDAAQPFARETGVGRSVIVPPAPPGSEAPAMGRAADSEVAQAARLSNDSLLTSAPVSLSPAPLPGVAAATPPLRRSDHTTGLPSSTALPHEASTQAELDQIVTVLQRFQAAYQRLDAGAAKRVWPTVDEQLLARAFQNLSTQDIAFASCDLSVTGSEADADCRGTTSYVPRGGDKQPRTLEREWTFRLSKVQDEWTITRAASR